jgi:general secretion pathway protein G
MPSPITWSPYRRGTVDSRPLHRSRGFTLLELIIVMSIIAIFLTIVIPTYSRSIVAAREKTLRSDLQSMRQAIWRYTLDKGKGPQGLDDLVTAGYLPKKQLIDPMTQKSDWEVTPPEDDVMLSIDQQSSGITDVHSASPGIASDGTPYTQW